MYQLKGLRSALDLYSNELLLVLGGIVRGADGGVVGDRLVDSVVSVLRALFLRVDLVIAAAPSVHED